MSTISSGTTSTTTLIHSGDTTGSLVFKTNDTGSGGTTAMTIDTSQNVAVGNTSPQAKLSVGAGTTAPGFGTASKMIYVCDTTQPEVLIRETGGSVVTSMYSDNATGNLRTATNHPLVFQTNNSERMRIDSSGNLLINTTSAYGGTTFKLEVNSTNYCMAVNATAGGTTDMIDFYSSGTFAGKISSNGATTAYNTSSDYRLKENIQPMTGALAKIQALKPVTFKWKFDGNDGEGFIAHELAEVCPYAVAGEKDEVDTDGNIKPQSVDTSFLVATLTASIQELKAINDQQAQTITALTARVEALEGK